MKRLVINADDYGLAHGVNVGILEARCLGAVTSVSQLSGAGFSPLAAIREAGVHLRLTDGEPVSNPESVQSLLFGGSRCFPRHRSQIEAPAFDQIVAEWETQIAHLGGQPTHFDTHAHSHALPTVFEAYAHLCQKYGVAGVPLSDRQACILRQMGVRCADYAEIRWRGRIAAQLPDLLREDFARYETVHLMTHPALVDDVLRRRSTMCEERKQEFSYLCSAEIWSFLAAEEIQLIGMDKLPVVDTLAKVDIVYLAHNRLRFTQESLKALAANTDWSRVGRLLLYDDGSTDGAREFIADATRFLDHMDVQALYGSFGGPVAVMNHYLSGEGRAAWFAKIDNDTMVPPGWLNACLDVLAAHPFVDLLGIEAKYPVDSYHQHDDGKRTAEPCSHVGGIGLFRSSAFAQLPEAKGRIGFGDWQNQHPEVTRAWLNPALPVFLLDRLPMAPWAGLSAAYEAKGWQRPWTRYTEADAALWGWWDGK